MHLPGFLPSEKPRSSKPFLTTEIKTAYHKRTKKLASELTMVFVRFRT
jgi:hypothetical protein